MPYTREQRKRWTSVRPDAVFKIAAAIGQGPVVKIRDKLRVEMAFEKGEYRGYALDSEKFAALMDAVAAAEEEMKAARRRKIDAVIELETNYKVV